MPHLWGLSKSLPPRHKDTKNHEPNRVIARSVVCDEATPALQRTQCDASVLAPNRIVIASSASPPRNDRMYRSFVFLFLCGGFWTSPPEGFPPRLAYFEMRYHFDMIGLWKHIDWLNLDQAIAAVYQPPRIARERGGIA